jgi:prepilin-type N-terminal cleavage/methylation domain-containing protein
MKIDKRDNTGFIPPMGGQAPRSAGFTLIELLVVIAIMLLIMGMGAVGYFGMRRGAEMRSAITAVRSTVMLARQQAVTKRTKVDLFFEQSGDTNLIRIVMMNATNKVYLPTGIEFDLGGSTTTHIDFGSRGGGGVGVATIKIRERDDVTQAGGIKAMADITIWRLTGITKVN